MFTPIYAVTNKLVANIKRITQIITTLNQRQFSKVILLDLEREAREVSAHSSTSIEGNPLPLTDVKKILKHLPAHIRDTEREVLNYNTALQFLQKNQQKKQKFDLPLILNIHKLVTYKLLPTTSSGKFRQAPVFVNNPKTRETIFWPPDYADVPSLIRDLVGFATHEQKVIDPLILAGIFHKQFVLIHPFIDGNGRTARLATTILLSGMGLNTFNLFSFERYYNANVSEYFSLVGEQGNYYDLKKIDLTSWLEYFTDGVLDELLRVQGELEKLSISPASGLKKHHQLLLQYLEEYGSITDAIYQTLVDRAKPTRALDFRFLLDQGMIERFGKGRATFYKLKQ